MRKPAELLAECSPYYFVCCSLAFQWITPCAVEWLIEDKSRLPAVPVLNWYGWIGIQT